MASSPPSPERSAASPTKSSDVIELGTAIAGGALKLTVPAAGSFSSSFRLLMSCSSINDELALTTVTAWLLPFLGVNASWRSRSWPPCLTTSVNDSGGPSSPEGS